jgi:hypothetical protein
VVETSAAVIFFESTSIWSCLAAIRLNVMLICIKDSWMALKLAVVVVEATSIAWAQPDQTRKKSVGKFPVGNFGRNRWL